MTISENYTIGQDDRLRERLRQSLNSVFNESEEFHNLQGLNTIVDWYREKEDSKDEEGTWNKHVIVSTVVNKTTDELIKHLEPFYKDTIISNIGMKTQFKQGATEISLNIEFISIKPFVKFVKQIDGRESSSVRLLFQLDTSIYLDKLRIQNSNKGKSISIEKLSIELKLSLLQVNISGTFGFPVILVHPVKLGSRRFEINEFVLFSRQSNFKVGAPLSS
jgi:hypothetical protein